jgi:septal ring factor EnvC (AmiA/AmiB activator)
MTTNAATVSFKLAQLQQEIIELERKYAVITEEDKQKLHQLRQTELSLRQNCDINLED